MNIYISLYWGLSNITFFFFTPRKKKKEKKKPNLKNDYETGVCLLAKSYKAEP